MSVPFYDHALLYRRRQGEIDAAIRRVLLSGQPSWGAEVPAFEAEFAAWLGAPHAVTCNSGTAALKIALMALGIGPGDEVITAPNSDISSTSSIRLVGATPVWVDVDPVTLTLDVGAIEAAIGPRTRAIQPVDLFGQPAKMPEIMRVARKHGLAVIEDACLALGATIDGVKLGHFADVTCFSFAPTKHLGSLGSGGAGVTHDAALAERMRKISAYGQSRERHYGSGAALEHLHHETEGLNERMDEIQAAILRVKLGDLDATLAARRAQASAYEAALSGLPVERPAVAPGCDHAWRNYVVHLDDRDRVRRVLADLGIATGLTYAPPLHIQPVYADLGYGTGRLPVAEASCARLMGLPLGPHLETGAMAEVAEGLLAALR